MPKRASSAALAATLLLAATAHAGPLQDDLAARRARAMDTLGPEALAIFWSAPTRVFFPHGRLV
jgi:hypothetical protein